MPNRTIRDPGAEVEQVLEATAPSVVTPELMQAIVAINRQVIDDTKGGTYANAAVTLNLPSLGALSVLDSATVAIKIQNEFGKFTIPKDPSTLVSLKKFKVNSLNTGVDLPDFLRVDRLSQDASSTGALTVTTGTLRQTIGTQAVTVSGQNITVPTAVFNSGGTQVFAGDILELVDVNNANTLRRFRILVVVSATVVTVESTAPDTLPALTAGSHTGIRSFLPLYTLTDLNALFLANRTRPVDDPKASGSKDYPQPGDTIGTPSTYTGLFSFADYKPLVGTPAIWRMKTWPSNTSITLDPAPKTTGAGPQWAGPPMFDASGLRYEGRTEEPAIGRIPSTLADVFFTYRALRRDLIGKAVKIIGVTQAVATFGPATGDNPLGLAMSLAASINATEEIMGTAIEADDAISHGVALNVLGLLKDPYFLSPISNKPDVAALYKAHVLQFSRKEERKERVAAIHLPIPLRLLRQDIGTAAVVVTSGPPPTITVPGALFLSIGTVPGDLVELHDIGQPATPLRHFVITAVVDQDTVEVASLNPDTLGALANGSHTLVKIVSPDFTASQKKDALVDTAEAFHERRLAFLQPDVVILSRAGVEYTVDGSYSGVAVCAMYTTQVPGKPLTGAQVPGILRISGSNSQFTHSQIRDLRSAGIMVLTQDNPASPALIDFEVSTNVDDVQVQQWSFTHLVDVIAKALRRSLDPLLGRNRMTEEFLHTAKLATTATMEKFKSRDKIITFYRVLRFEPGQPDETLPDFNGAPADAILINIKVTVPKVANNADVTLFI